MTESGTYEDDLCPADGATIGLRAEYNWDRGYRATLTDPGQPPGVELGRVWYWAEQRNDPKKGRWVPVTDECWGILCQLGLLDELRRKIREAWEAEAAIKEGEG